MDTQLLDKLPNFDEIKQYSIITKLSNYKVRKIIIFQSGYKP